MADSTLDSELFVLNGAGWGVAPVSNGDIPNGGFDGVDHHNVATAVFPLGEVRQVYCNGDTGQEGYSRFIYLKVGTQNADSAIAAKSVCVRHSATKPFEVTNNADDCIHIPTDVGAIAISAMTDAYYGWFVEGGVIPEQYISGLGGNYATDGAVAAGPITFHDLTADYIGFGPAAIASGTAAATPEPICGDALAADA